MTHFLSWLLPAWGLGHGHGIGLEAIAQASGQAWASAKAMAMALGFRPLPGPQAKPGLRPRHKPDCQKAKANGHKLVAMAKDISYPGVRVGEACGPGVAS